jgi:hypothetical protein
LIPSGARKGSLHAYTATVYPLSMAFGTLISVYVSIDRGLDFSFVRIYLNVPQHRDLKRLFSLRPGGYSHFS